MFREEWSHFSAGHEREESMHAGHGGLLWTSGVHQTGLKTGKDVVWQHWRRHYSLKSSGCRR